MPTDVSANVQNVERFAEAFNRGDLDSLLALCHQDIEVKLSGRQLARPRRRPPVDDQVVGGQHAVEVATDRITEAGDSRVVQQGECSKSCSATSTSA
jgi:ketosteroid isomerase-like protein